MIDCSARTSVDPIQDITAEEHTREPLPLTMFGPADPGLEPIPWEMTTTLSETGDFQTQDMQIEHVFREHQSSPLSSSSAAYQEIRQVNVATLESTKLMVVSVEICEREYLLSLILELVPASFGRT